MEKFLERELSKISNNKFMYYRIASLLSFVGSSAYSGYVGDNNINIILSYLYAWTLINCFERIKKMQENEKLHNLYNQYVSNIADLVKKIEIDDNVIKINDFFSIMLRNGDLSLDRNYTFGTERVVDLFKENLYGAEISRGTGVCRHIVRLLRDVLNKLEYESDFVYMNLLETTNSDKLAILNLPVEFLSFFGDASVDFVVEDKISRKYGNHVTIGLLHDGKYIIMDPTNIDYFLPFSVLRDSNVIRPEVIEKIKEIDIYDDRLNYELNDKTILFNSNFNFGILKSIGRDCGLEDMVTLERFKYENVSDKIDNIAVEMDELCDIRDEIIDRYKDNRDIIDKFYEENKDLYREIDSIMSTKQRKKKRKTRVLINKNSN